MRILIEDLTFQAILGILPQERTASQEVRIDCIIDYTYEKDLFINYADVTEHIVRTMQKEKFELIETALSELSSTLKKHFPRIEALDLTIRKPDILANCTVGVRQTFIF